MLIEIVNITPAALAIENRSELLSYLEHLQEHIDDIRQYAYNKGLVDAEEKQQDAESDAIKGGDFISDGKRVFLVLANVKERNLGETGSTFCEGHILGVDGVVYCNGDNFKKFKRATSDERAKFIHDLKVGVELKEQPAERSGEEIVSWTYDNFRASSFDMTKIVTNFSSMDELERSLREKLKSLRPQPSWKPSEEQMKALMWQIKNTSEGSWQRRVSEDLYNDLQKLL